MAHESAEAIRSLEQEVAELRWQLQRTQSLHAVSVLKQTRAQNEEAQTAWRRHIHAFDFPPEFDGILDALLKESTLQLPDLLPCPEQTQSQPWHSPNYRVSYPALRDFLAVCDIRESSKASLTLDSFGWDELSHDPAYFRSFTRHEKYAELWDILRSRTTNENIGNASNAATRVEAISKLKRLIPSRSIQITDLSPLLSSIILASVPRFNLNTVAAFFDRYLAGASFGTALLQSWSKKIKTQHAFAFEYHVSFFYVPGVMIHPDLPTHDFRRLKRPNGIESHLRRGTPFTFNSSEPSRWIYEEQRSFLLVGCGPYVQTSIQLAENYFTGPFVRSYGRRLFPAPESQPRPAQMFLNWLQYTMHLVNGRWQQAIEAVNSCIHTSSDIIFAADHLDLLSDDPQFSRSKTYFWALQAYKMFDEKLTITIATWTDFRENKLRWVNDGKFTDEDWTQNVGQIQKSIDELHNKRHFIRSKSEEVRHLREGLFGASSLFDSRTAVRQGDNIRLLTWITILFLPLTFCTSIFGMQVVLPNLPIHVFVVTMPCVFLGTAFVMFNASNMIDQGERLAQWVAGFLRNRMKEHHHNRWQSRLDALQKDKQNLEAPVRRVQRQSSRWTYIVFGLTLLLFDLPVHEIEWTLAHVWLLQLHVSGRLVHKVRPAAPTDPEASPSISAVPSSVPSISRKDTQSRSNTVEFDEEEPQRKTRALRRSQTIRTIYAEGFSWSREDSRRVLLKALLKCLTAIQIAVRILLLVVWLPLVFAEYIILLPLIALDPVFWFSQGSGNLHGNLFQQPLQWLGFGVVAKINDTRSYKPSNLRQAVILFQRAKQRWEPVDAVSGERSWKKLRQRRMVPEATSASNGDHARLSHDRSASAQRDRPRAARASSAMGRIITSTGRRLSVSDFRSPSPGLTQHDRGRSRLGDDLRTSSPTSPVELSPTPRPPRRLLSRSRSRERSQVEDHGIHIEVTDASRSAE